MGEPQQQKFCLKWNNYLSSVSSTFKDLLAVEDFVDVTIAVDTGTIKAHKVVLSACSPYFRHILKGIAEWQHPVIVLKDVAYADLRGIVEFIYHGEVSVDREALDSFLAAAQALHVKGLTDGTSERAEHPRKSARPIKKNVDNPAAEDNDDDDDDDEEEEIDDVEEEDAAAVANGDRSSGSGNDVVDDADVDDEDEEEEEEELPAVGLPGPFLGLNPQTITNAAAAAAWALAGSADRKDPAQDTELYAAQSMGLPALKMLGGAPFAAQATPLQQQHQRSPCESGSSGGGPAGKKTCPYCLQQLSWHALSRHIRDMHRARAGGLVTCKHCNKTFRNKNSLGCHMWRFHKNKAAGADDSVGGDQQQQQQQQQQQPKMELI